MATLISQIIQDAYREANLVAAEADPTANQITEGLRLLNRYIRQLFGNELGVPLEAIPYGENNVDTKTTDQYYYNSILNYFIPPNTRLNCNLSQARSLELYPSPQDGARFAIHDISANFATNPLTLSGNGRTIGGADSLVLNTNGQDVEYFYRADLGDWKQVSDLVSSDESPFPVEFDDLLIIGLTLRLASRYGVELTMSTERAYARVLRQFKARYSQIVPEGSELALIMTPGTKRQNIWSLEGLFEKGHPIYGR